MGSAQDVFSEEPYETPELTLTTPINKLEVLCELMVDFKNLKDNGFDLLSVVKIQGWEKYFDRLQGPFSFTWLENFGFMLRLQFFKLLPLLWEKL